MNTNALVRPRRLCWPSAATTACGSGGGGGGGGAAGKCVASINKDSMKMACSGRTSASANTILEIYGNEM